MPASTDRVHLRAVRHANCPRSPEMSFRILLVDPDSVAAAASAQALVHTGYRVVPVGTFEEATRRMSVDRPDLLVTKVRLGSFNGLHLLLRCRAEYPDVPVIIVGTAADRTPDVTRFGAEFVTSPVEPASFLKLVAALLSGRRPSRHPGAQRGPRKHAVIPVVASDRSARLVQTGYGGIVEPGCGGLPLEMAMSPGGGAELALPGLDVTRRWRLATRRWRWTVDSLN
jgi:CheY-like chemotaxis protein